MPGVLRMLRLPPGHPEDVIFFGQNRHCKLGYGGNGPLPTVGNGPGPALRSACGIVCRFRLERDCKSKIEPTRGRRSGKKQRQRLVPLCKIPSCGESLMEPQVLDLVAGLVRGTRFRERRTTGSADPDDAVFFSLGFLTAGSKSNVLGENCLDFLSQTALWRHPTSDGSYLAEAEQLRSLAAGGTFLWRRVLPKCDQRR